MMWNRNVTCNKQNSARDSHVAPGCIKVHVSVMASNAMHLFCSAPRSKWRLNSILSWKEIHFDAAKARELNAVDLMSLFHLYLDLHANRVITGQTGLRPLPVDRRQLPARRAFQRRQKNSFLILRPPPLGLCYWRSITANMWHCW